MFTFLIILITLIAILLVLVVLLQSGRGGGLAGIAAGGAQQVLGARQAPDILEKTTWTLAVIFVVLCILTNFTIDTTERRESIIQQRAQQEQIQPTLPPTEQPTAPSGETPTPIPPANPPNNQN